MVEDRIKKEIKEREPLPQPKPEVPKVKVTEEELKNVHNFGKVLSKKVNFKSVYAGNVKRKYPNVSKIKQNNPIF